MYKACILVSSVESNTTTEEPQLDGGCILNRSIFECDPEELQLKLNSRYETRKKCFSLKNSSMHFHLIVIEKQSYHGTKKSSVAEKIEIFQYGFTTI